MYRLFGDKRLALETGRLITVIAPDGNTLLQLSTL